MTSEAERFAAAAEALVGIPFRLHGRDRRTGLDCVGVVLAALGDIGRAVPSVEGYALRRTGWSDHFPLAEAAGLMPAQGQIECGDLLLAQPGPAQAHLLIAVRGGGCIHAHAGLGRVVKTPPPCPWPVKRRWRLASD